MELLKPRKILIFLITTYYTYFIYAAYVRYKLNRILRILTDFLGKTVRFYRPIFAYRSYFPARGVKYISSNLFRAKIKIYYPAYNL